MIEKYPVMPTNFFICVCVWRIVTNDARASSGETFIVAYLLFDNPSYKGPLTIDTSTILVCTMVHLYSLYATYSVNDFGTSVNKQAVFRFPKVARRLLAFLPISAFDPWFLSLCCSQSSL